MDSKDDTTTKPMPPESTSAPADQTPPEVPTDDLAAGQGEGPSLASEAPEEPTPPDGDKPQASLGVIDSNSETPAADSTPGERPTADASSERSEPTPLGGGLTPEAGNEPEAPFSAPSQSFTAAPHAPETQGTDTAPQPGVPATAPVPAPKKDKQTFLVLLGVAIVLVIVAAVLFLR